MMSNHRSRHTSHRAQPKVRRIFGALLRRRRVHRKWSQLALGKRAGLSAKFVGELERGEKSPTLDTLAAIARALDRNSAVFLQQLAGKLAA